MFLSLRRLLVLGLVPLLCPAQSPIDKLAPNKTVASPTASDGLAGAAALGDANAFYRNGDFVKAAAKYRELLQDKPASPDGWAGLIRSYLKAKNVSAAAQSAEQGLAAVDHPRIHTAHAEVLFRQGEIIEAEKEWVKVVNSYPDARAYLGLAKVWRAYSMYGGAAQMIAKAHNLNPEDPDIKELWLTTLPQNQQVEQLRKLLVEETKLDESQRADISRFLDSAVEWRKEHQCRLVSKLNEMETPLHRISGSTQLHRVSGSTQRLRGYSMAVTLNGQPSELLLDTGASGIVVDSSAAARAGIGALIPTEFAGVGGTGRTTGLIGFAESIKIGEMEFRNCPIRVSESHSPDGEDGLIGTDVFQKFLVDVDFPEEKIKLLPLPPRPGVQAGGLSLTYAATENEETIGTRDGNPQDRYIAPEMQSFTRVYRFGHLLLLATSIGDVPPKLFVLDTGAADDFISPAAAEEVTKVHHQSNLRIRGLTGSVNDVYTAKKTMIRFGHLGQQIQEMIAFDTTAQSENTGTEISGFLGFSTLRMLDIQIDYRDGLVDFSYSAEKWKKAKHRH